MKHDLKLFSMEEIQAEEVDVYKRQSLDMPQ